MGQLKLDDIGRKALLIKARRRHCSKAVTGNFFARVAHAAQREIDGVFADGSMSAPQRREDVPPGAGDGFEIAHNFKCLTWERNDVLIAHLYAAGRDPPLGMFCTEIKLRPFGGTKLGGANEK